MVSYVWNAQMGVLVAEEHMQEGRIDIPDHAVERYIERIAVVLRSEAREAIRAIVQQGTRHKRTTSRGDSVFTMPDSDAVAIVSDCRRGKMRVVKTIITRAQLTHELQGEPPTDPWEDP